MSTAIKICGITRVEDALLCEKLEVDFVGLNMVRTSPRCITPEAAKNLRGSLKKSIPVLIFQNEDPEIMRRIAQEVGCTHIQCHGEEDLAEIGKLPLTVIKAFRTVPDASVLQKVLQSVRYVMIDGSSNGQSADLDAAEKLPLPIRKSLFIAGGLTPANVAGTLKRLQPFAVDTASGVEETPGIKSEKLLRAFVSSVRSVSPLSL